MRVVFVEYHTGVMRAGLIYFCPTTNSSGAIVHSPSVGTLKYVRADLLRWVGHSLFPAQAMTHPRVMFASYHCYHDPASGAAICTRDLFARWHRRAGDVERSPVRFSTTPLRHPSELHAQLAGCYQPHRARRGQVGSRLTRFQDQVAFR